MRSVIRVHRSLNWPLRLWRVGVYRGHPHQHPRPWFTIIVGPLWLHVYRWTRSQ